LPGDGSETDGVDTSTLQRDDQDSDSDGIRAPTQQHQRRGIPATTGSFSLFPTPPSRGRGEHQHRQHQYQELPHSLRHLVPLIQGAIAMIDNHERSITNSTDGDDNLDNSSINNYSNEDDDDNNSESMSDNSDSNNDGGSHPDDTSAP
jgi:hypothetical protein